MKARVTIILAVVFAAVVGIVLFTQQKGSINENIATVRYIKANHVNIACEDAEAIAWLIPDLLKERDAQLAAYEEENGAIKDEELRDEIYYRPTETLQTLHIWNDEVMYAIERLYERDAEKFDLLLNSIAEDFGFIYTLMSEVYRGNIKTSEAENAIKERFCSDGHDH